MNPVLSKLKSERKKKGLTTTDLAKSIGISQSMYSYIENGIERLSYDLAVKLSEFFNTTPDKLFYDDFKNN